MTKTTKRALSIVLTIIMTLSLFVTAFAAITLDEAKAIALKDAGFAESEVQFVTAKDDKEDKEFEIEFYQGKAEYDYSVNYEGKIVAFSFDSNSFSFGTTASFTSIQSFCFSGSFSNNLICFKHLSLTILHTELSSQLKL